MSAVIHFIEFTLAIYAILILVFGTFLLMHALFGKRMRTSSAETESQADGSAQTGP